MCSYLDKPSDQDDDLQFQKHETNENLLEMCDTLHQLHNCPPSFKRKKDFLLVVKLKPLIGQLSPFMYSPWLLSMTILSYIFRNFSEIQSTFLFGETLRVFQWNVLAQSLGKENDNFVR